MEESIARQEALKQRIHVEQIAREWWEMVILKDIFDSALGGKIVFKGGTALRLAYGSPRFSEDIDLSLISAIDFALFEKTLRNLESKFTELKIKDLWPKHYTLLGEYRVKEPWLGQAFSIKLEVSKRVKKVEFESMVISSPVSNIQVIANVYTIDQILREKKEALETRKKSRDIFDLWYIGQRFKKDIDISGSDIPLKQLTQELRKYLPTNYWKVIPSLAKRK